MISRLWVVWAVSCTLPVGVCLAEAQAVPVVDPAASATDLFRLYSEGRHEAVVLALSTSAMPNAAAESWLKSVHNQINHWPREVAATFVLEAAQATYLSSWYSIIASPLIEEGRQRLLWRHAPDAFEKQWHLAVAALVNGPASARRGRRAENGLASDHVLDDYFDEVKRRFPHDPEIALARGVYLEAGFHRWLDTWGVGVVRPGDAMPTLPPFYASRLEEAAAAASSGFGSKTTSTSPRARDWVFLVDGSQSLSEPRGRSSRLIPTLPPLLAAVRKPEDRLQVIQFASAMRRVDLGHPLPPVVSIDGSQTALFDTMLAAVM